VERVRRRHPDLSLAKRGNNLQTESPGMEQQIRRLVTDTDAGLRLDQFLALQPEVGSRARARALVDGGKVLIRGEPAKASLVLRASQAVEFTAPPPEPDDPLRSGELPPPPLRVLFADEWLVAIDKPAGLASHPPEDRDFRGHTVASAVRAQFGSLPSLAGDDRPGIVHRLDRETSGAMVLARNEEAFHFLRAQFKGRLAQKEYRCIAYGESRFDSDWIERRIAPDDRHPDRMTVVEEGGRESSTYYEVVERFAGFTHFRCRPRTGRTHQIRVHMASIGHSLVGDRIYRSRRAQHDALPAGAPDPRRHCLHALRLSLQHPCTHESIEFEAGLPQDLQALLAWLRANRPPT
jgi:23S rRNA pseudouridine1911/1915/1917 synthase